jgi:hypothetical protein
MVQNLYARHGVCPGKNPHGRVLLIVESCGNFSALAPVNALQRSATHASRRVSYERRGITRLLRDTSRIYDASARHSTGGARRSSWPN